MNEDTTVWFLAGDDNQPKGPYRTAEVLDALTQGKLDAGNLCWKEGMPEWRPLSQVEPFSEAPLPTTIADKGPETANLGRAFSKVVGLTRKTAKTVSLKVTIGGHEKRRQQLLSELGEMLYKREADIALLSQEPYAEKLRQIQREDQSIEALRRQIESIEQAGGGPG